MAVLRFLVRMVVVTVAVGLLLVGGLAIGIGHFPDDVLVATGRDSVFRLTTLLADAEVLGLPGDLPTRVDNALAGILLRFGAAPAGLLLLVAALLRGGASADPSKEEEEAASEFPEPVAPVDAKLLRKARKQAESMARKGDTLEAAEYCFASGLMERAADYFVESGELVRAAEIRHDQKRFLEAAELYEKAGRFEAAGTIFGQQGEHARAASAYSEAGNKSVAAEMYEQAEDFKNAAECYAESGFPRHAARAYVRCRAWKRAAICLEEVIREELAGTAATVEPRKAAEKRKLVRMAGDLYTRAGLDEQAQAVLEAGECFGEAAEVALRGGRQEEAAELFLKAADAPRAAGVLEQLGRNEESVLVLAEYHRDRGDDAEAARYFEEGGDYIAAGDLYRMLDQCQKAGECYERQGEHAQAAEMFRSVEDRERAATNYERAGAYAQAAECFALSGDSRREAELLVQAGEYLRAGVLFAEGEDEEAAIQALQQVVPEHADFARASALLGEIFQKRGMLAVALTKLKHATADVVLGRDNVRAFYALAAVHEADGDPSAAVGIFEKILAFDYGYGDVHERLGRAREALERETERQRAAADSAGPASGSQQQGRYEILGQLGRGGMGIVYKARDTVLDRTVAFKVLPQALQENPQALKNFLREAKSAARLNHPNIVTVYDAGEQDDAYYIAMEFVDGNTLKDIIQKRGRISPAGIVHVLSQMCEALAYAHDNKIVHRDVKSANTMWTRDRKAKIMDFGLAKVIEEVRNHTTVVSGTPYYMSPEQTLGKNVDHRTDIYSLGVTLFEMATATLPFREGNLPYHHVHTPPPNPLELNPDLPSTLANIIDRCLEKDPAHRYQSTREILDRLREA